MKHAMNTSHEIHVAFEKAGQISAITGENTIEILCAAMDASRTHPTKTLFDVLAERLIEAGKLATYDETWELTEQGICASGLTVPPADFEKVGCTPTEILEGINPANFKMYNGDGSEIPLDDHSGDIAPYIGYGTSFIHVIATENMKAGEPVSIRERIQGVLFAEPLKPPYINLARNIGKSEHLKQGLEYHKKLEEIYKK